MPDLEIIKALEKQIDEPIQHYPFEDIMNAGSRCGYTVDENQQVIGLNLQNCQLSNIIWLKKLKHLKKLNLSLNPLEKIFALKELNFLNCLNLQKTGITEIEALKNLIQLQKLNLQDNQIQELKPLRQLHNLTHLNLQANQITQLKYLEELTDLSVLNLNSNQINDLTGLLALTKLTSLSLNANQLNQFQAIENLPQLTELDLRFNQIKKIDSLAALHNLTHLYLNANEIFDLEPLKNLNTLTHLYLSTNKITHLEALSALHDLIELDLRFNFITDILPLTELTQLKVLLLEHNQINDISAVKNFNQLTVLNLRNNQINSIDSVQGLQYLKELYLSQNHIEYLPEWIIDFNLKIKWSTGGDGISLSGNPIVTPPLDIIYQGTLAIKKYFKTQAQQQRSDLDEIRIFLVGDSGVGKTTLAKLLRDKPFSLNELKTQAITILDWQYQNINLHIWDFGGDLSLQAIHTLFLTNNAVYVLVLTNSLAHRVSYWLKKIAYFAPDAPVLVVINYLAEVDNSDFVIKNLIKQSSSLSENHCFSLSCQYNFGINEFKEGLIKAVKNLPMMKNLFLESWMKIKNAIKLQQKSHPFISLDTYQQLCVQYGIEELENQRQLAQLLHEIGVCIYLEKTTITDVYLIEPHWFIYSLYCTLTAKKLRENNGRLVFKSLGQLLKDNNPLRYHYSVKEYQYLIKLILSQQIGYLADKYTLIIPQLLTTQEPIFEFNEATALRFRFYYYYLDEMTLSRFMIQLHEDIELCWRTGVVLQNAQLNCRALVKINFVDALITISVSGEKKRDYFFILQKVLQNMNRVN